MNLSKFSAGLLITIMSGALSAGVAFADNVVDVIALPNTDTIVEGGNTTVGYKIQAVSGSGDTENGCNAADGTAATVNINTPAGVTATPSSLVFTACTSGGSGSNTQNVVFSSAVAGDYSITTSVVDNGGGTYVTSGSAFTLHVTAAPVVIVDTTAPTLSLPSDMTVEATSAAGATVTYSASATDVSPASPVVSCTPASGSTFPLGATLVSCSATDAANNTATGSFSVTVVDTTAPGVPTPTSPADNTFTTTANQTLIDWSDSTDADNVSTPVTYVYEAANIPDVTGLGAFTTPIYTSGTLTISEIPTLGTQEGVYYWHARALDSIGNASAWSTARKITVDNTAPVLTVPSSMNTEATGPDGASVNFSSFVSATDNYTVNPIIICTPDSGSTFSIGVTTVECTATDDAGNMSTASFDVTIHDTTAPTGTLQINSDAVYTNNAVVTLNLSATDAVGVTGYRIADGTDASAATTVAVTSTTGLSITTPWTLPAGDGSKTVAIQYRDAAGNWSDNAIDSITLDTAAPTVTIVAPTATAYTLGQTVNANYNCTDTTSGTATCVGTVTNGTPIDTATAGLKAFTVNSTDNAGNVSTPQTVSYSVGYNPTTFSAGNPISMSSKDYKSKSTIPVKFTIKDWLNHPYGLATATIGITKGATVIPVVASGSSNSGNLFRYDTSAGQYIYNLSTKTTLPVGTYTLTITVDGTTPFTQTLIIK